MPTLIGYLNHHVHHFTAQHPLYRSLIDYPPEGYKIVEGGDDKDSYPAWVPTCPVSTQRKHFVFIEDWHTLFDCGNGASAAFDIAGPLVQEKKRWLAQNNVLGVLTHMKATVADCITLFGQELAHKIHYVPLALPPVHFPPRDQDIVRFLWTSSHGGSGQESCWRLRGGPETLEGFRRLGDCCAELTMLGTPQGDLFFSSPLEVDNAIAVKSAEFLSEEEIHRFYASRDIYVIPSVRIHSIAVARALMYGMPVICSDGWGYREFITEGVEGFMCKGQHGLTSWHDGVFREDYSKMPTVNEELAKEVAEAMRVLLNPYGLAKMSQAALASSDRFSIERRNVILKGILDKHLT